LPDSHFIIEDGILIINMPSADKLSKVAQYLGVSLDYLLNNAPPRENPYNELTEEEIKKVESYKAYLLSQRGKADDEQAAGKRG